MRNYSYVWEAKWRPADPRDPLTRGASGYLPTWPVRLFRNHSAHRYAGRLHQCVGPSIRRRGGRLGDADVPIHHYGFLRVGRVKSPLYRALARHAHQRLGAHARAGERARNDERARAQQYFAATLESLVRRRETAPAERVAALDGQAEATRAERARWLQEIDEAHQPRLDLRPFRLHLVATPALQVPARVRRGPTDCDIPLPWLRRLTAGMAASRVRTSTGRRPHSGCSTNNTSPRLTPARRRSHAPRRSRCAASPPSWRW